MRLFKIFFRLSLFFLLLLHQEDLQAQMPGMMRRMQNMGGSGGGVRPASSGGSDSLSFEKRNFAADSVNAQFKYLDTAKYLTFDSSISDFYKRVPLKPWLANIGYNGNPTRSLLFNPMRGIGWDGGFHVLDPFAFTIQESRFMNTTKAYTELGYLVGSKAEQQISVLHTQNISPDWNAVAQYRLITAPGTFNSQNSSHNNIRINSDYTSKNRRYHAYLIILSNALQSSENGGIKDPAFLVNENPAYNDRFNVPTNLAPSIYSSRNFFKVNLLTGNRYTIRSLLYRHQFDFGKKDSTVTDSNVISYYLPRLRLEHTIEFSSNNYDYLDVQPNGAATFYSTHYGISDLPDTVSFSMKNPVFKNDFSIIQFPNANNLLQFFKAGASLMQYRNLSGVYNDPFANILLHGEYRNLTRNKKWDMLLYCEFITAGRDIGNYVVKAHLQRSLGAEVGNLQIGFENTNRTPSYIYKHPTAFPLRYNAALADENISNLNGVLYLKNINAFLQFNYFLVSNYTYLKNFTDVDQYGTAFQLLRGGLMKEIRLYRNFKWSTELFVQSIPSNTPIHLPSFFTRNRIGYEGKPFRNLILASGVEIRYHSAYYADGYSPLNGQFFYQTAEKINNRPDIHIYNNLRIRSFTGFVRLENLNTASRQYGFGFKQNNFAAPLYPTPGLVFRLGVFWNFVN
jgi:hypothetical protein